MLRDNKKKLNINIIKSDILDTITDAILVLDSDLIIIYTNKAFYDIFKVKPNNSINSNFLKIKNGQFNNQKLSELLYDILPNKKFIKNLKIQLLFPDLGQKIILINAKQLSDGNNKEKFIFINLRDITEKTALLKSAFQTNKLAMIGQFSASIVHGLSSPLTGIYNILDIYMKEEPKNSSRSHELKLLLGACDYMDKIIKNLIYFARTTKGKNEKVSITDIIEPILSFTNSQFIAAGIYITKDIPGNIKKISGNKNQLQHVFLNILLNAKESISNGGKIIIKAKNSLKDKRVILTITDNGKGISKQNLPHIYDPFFSTKPETQSGAGLGLSAAYGIIKDHRGNLLIESEEGKGTRIIIKLPFAK